MRKETPAEATSGNAKAERKVATQVEQTNRRLRKDEALDHAATKWIYWLSLSSARKMWASPEKQSLFQMRPRQKEVLAAYRRLRQSGHHPYAALFNAFSEMDL